MTQSSLMPCSWLFLLSAIAVSAGCGSDVASPPSGASGSSPAAGTSGHPSSAQAGASNTNAGGAPGIAGTGSGGLTDPPGTVGQGGSIAVAGSGTDLGGAPGLAGSGSSGAPGAAGKGSAGGGGRSSGGGAPGSAGSGSGSGGGSVVVVDPACKLSNPVSFKKDIEPFLGTSCGNSGRTGCHVTDSSSTVNSACPDGTNKCGFDHAYDWITAGSHNEFCKQTPGPIRFTVVMAVVKAANPATCTASRVMPPTGARLTACQMSALEAWLAEPRVLQTHRKDDTSPAEPYLMPPYN